MTGRLASKPTRAATAAKPRPQPQAKAQARAAVAPQPVMPRPKLMLSQQEAADEIGIGLTCFEDERDAGRIHVVHIGKRRLVAYAEIVRYVRTLYDEAGWPLDEIGLLAS